MAVNVSQDRAENVKVGVGVVFTIQKGKSVSGAVKEFSPTEMTENGFVIYRMVLRSAAKGGGCKIQQLLIRADQPITIITEG